MCMDVVFLFGQLFLSQESLDLLLPCGSDFSFLISYPDSHLSVGRNAALISRFSNMSSVQTADMYSTTSGDCLMTGGFPQQLLESEQELLGAVVH